MLHKIPLVVIGLFAAWIIMFFFVHAKQHGSIAASGSNYFDNLV